MFLDVDKKKVRRKKIFWNFFWLILLAIVGFFSFQLFMPFLTDVKQLETEQTLSIEKPTDKSPAEIQAELRKKAPSWFQPGVMSNLTKTVSSLNQVPAQGGWFNSVPLDFNALRAEGAITLLYFWSSSNLNSLALNPYMEWLWQQYKDYGLVIVGVHSPTFAVEKNPAVVWKIIKQQGLTFPILLDGDHKIWNRFNVEEVPAQYIFDTRGKLVYSTVGIDNERIENQYVRGELTGAGWLLPTLNKMPNLGFNNRHSLLPITVYAGSQFRRRVLDNDNQGQENRVSTFVFPKIASSDDCISLNGTWLVTPEYVESKSPGQIKVSFSGNKTYVYFASAVKKAIMISMNVDDKPISHQIAGKDIQFQGENSLISVRPASAKLYRIINDHLSNSQHTLIMTVPVGVRFYFISFYSHGPVG